MEICLPRTSDLPHTPASASSSVSQSGEISLHAWESIERLGCEVSNSIQFSPIGFRLLCEVEHTQLDSSEGVSSKGAEWVWVVAWRTWQWVLGCAWVIDIIGSKIQNESQEAEVLWWRWSIRDGHSSQASYATWGRKRKRVFLFTVTDLQHESSAVKDDPAALTDPPLCRWAKEYRWLHYLRTDPTSSMPVWLSMYLC